MLWVLKRTVSMRHLFKQMFKLMDKKILTILGPKFLLIYSAAALEGVGWLLSQSSTRGAILPKISTRIPGIPRVSKNSWHSLR